MVADRGRFPGRIVSISHLILRKRRNEVPENADHFCSLLPIGATTAVRAREREYCVSKARNAAWTLSPKPAMPSSVVGPSNATKVRQRIDSTGRRTAAGLPGCAEQ